MLNEPSIVDREVEAALRGEDHEDHDGTGEPRFECADGRERLQVPAGGR